MARDCLGSISRRLSDGEEDRGFRGEHGWEDGDRRVVCLWLLAQHRHPRELLPLESFARVKLNVAAR